MLPGACYGVAMLVSSQSIHFAKNVKGHDVVDVYRGAAYAQRGAAGRPHPGWWVPAGLTPTMRNLRNDGGPGDLLAVGTSDRPKMPGGKRVVVLAQHAKYTHIGVIVSDDLPAPESSVFNHYYRWIRVLAVGDERHETSSSLVMDPVEVARWPWFQAGGAYCEVSRAEPLRGPANRREWCDAVWGGFGLADEVEADSTPVIPPYSCQKSGTPSENGIEPG